MSRQGATYFHHLNYTLANEDSSVELAVLPDGASHVLCVAGSGARMLPLIARGPKRVTCVDVSQGQLHLAELRVEAARVLSHDQYLAFWGYPPRLACPEERQDLIARLSLSAAARAYFEQVFAHRKWGSILYDGRWEQTFAKLSRVNGKLTGEAGRRLFEARTHEQHKAYMARHFPRLGWLATLLLIGNPVVFNLMLYRGGFPRKNIPGTPFAFYRHALDQLFDIGPARENFFLQIVFFGELRYPEGNPIECTPETFASIQQGLAKTEVVYRRGDLFEVAGIQGDRYDFASLSDVPSYFRPPLEQTHLQDLRRTLLPGARVVSRYYIR
ncbi:MAG: DUF3419 family protein, partial [Polyangiaceae bacterium]|nr:DUF3419 family protein [Polyangiaceae bacterium]